MKKALVLLFAAVAIAVGALYVERPTQVAAGAPPPDDIWPVMVSAGAPPPDDIWPLSQGAGAPPPDDIWPAA
jgi:hypothetical protein